MSEVLLVSYFALWLLVAVQTLLIVGLVKTTFSRDAESQSHYDEHPVIEGRPAPEFTAETVSGDYLASADLSGQSRVFLFLSPGCPSCAVTLGELEALKHKASGQLVLVCQDTREACRRLVDVYGIDYPVVIDTDYDITKRFGVVQIPSAVIVNADDRVKLRGRRLEDHELERVVETLDDSHTRILEEVSA